MVLLTYVTEPFAKWLGGDNPNLENYIPVTEYSEKYPERNPLVELETWLLMHH